MKHSVFLNSSCTWVDVIEYRVWLNEYVAPGKNFFNAYWEVTMVSDRKTQSSKYVINFERAEDATAFKLKFNV